MAKTPKSTFPRAFSKNLSQLIKHDKLREAETPYHLKLMNKAIQFFGSVRFLWANVLVFILWVGFNVGPFTFAKHFDPYPFEFLTLSVSLEAIILSVIVLIAQNKLQSDSDERAQLDLHINLLAESETTLILKKLERIERHLKIQTEPDEDQRVKDLIEETHPEKLAQFIHETFCPKTDAKS